MVQHLFVYVEDDDLSREIMEMVFEDFPSYQLVTFSDSADFLQRIESLSEIPSVFLLDIHVQPYTGFQMLEMLRASKQYQHIPVLALTASVMNEEISHLKSAGFDGAIAKPIDQDLIAEYLESALTGRPVWTVINNFN